MKSSMRNPSHLIADSCYFIFAAPKKRSIASCLIFSRRLRRPTLQKWGYFPYFFSYEVPKIEGIITPLMNNAGWTVDVSENLFPD